MRCRFVSLAPIFAAIGLSFSPGNIIALRVSTCPGCYLSDSATAIFVDEIAANGTLSQPIPVPATGPFACTLAGNATSEGQLSMSPNGANVGFACYLAPVGTDAVVQRGGTRAVVVLNANASLSTPQGMGLTYTVPPRHVHTAVIADTSINFYVSGEGRNVSYYTS
jgi:hypothetical protein